MIVDKDRSDQLAIIFTRGIADKGTVEKILPESGL
jgi:hypothetical protein